MRRWTVVALAHIAKLKSYNASEKAKVEEDFKVYQAKAEREAKVTEEALEEKETVLK